MPVEVLSPLHREELVDFLAGVFRLPRNAPFVAPKLLDWKYDQPRPDWPGSRSYAWMEDGRIAAHAGLCPVTYLAGSAEVRASYLIDWAAGRRVPGSGVHLLRTLADSFQVLLALGGSADTQQILPRLGYRIGGEFAYFVRVIRPWGQHRTDPVSRGWKGPIRLARNVVWSLAAAPQAPPQWTASPVAAFNTAHLSLLQAATQFPSTIRTPELMNYWLRCPGAGVAAFVVNYREVPCGWYVLSRVAGVVRIADLRVHSQDPQHWRAAYALATRTALADSHACELVATASTPLAHAALEQNGFRFHHTDPIYLLDPNGLLAGHAPLEVALIESDLAYLYTPEYPYLT